MKTGLLLIFSALMLLSCEKELSKVEHDSCFKINSTDTIEHVLNSKWTFLGFLNKTTRKEECKPGSIQNMTISFEYDNRLKAINACNSFEGYLNKLGNDSIQIDSLVTTLLYCSNDTVMSWEKDYFTCLNKTISYKISYDILTLITSTELDLIFRFESDNTPITNN